MPTIKAQKPEKKFWGNVELLEEFDGPAETAAFYGFTPIKTFRVTRDDRLKTSCFLETCKNKKGGSQKIKISNLTFTPEEKASVWRIYRDCQLEAESHPAMFYFKKPKLKKGSDSKHRLGLAIIGSEAGMAEVLMIKTAMAILSDHGIKNTLVEINCTGNKDSISRFEKELANYYRKNLDSLPEDVKNDFKDDVWKILHCKDERCREFIENAPQAMSFLTPPSIQHFKEILEYLETLEIPYKINNYLVGHKNCCPQTLFEIKEVRGSEEREEGKIRVSGYRHNHFSKKIGFKKDIPAIVADLIFNKTPAKKKTGRQQKSQFYFVQIGPQAKVKSLNIIECLRKSGIRISHSLTKDKLTSQIDLAEKSKVLYLIIMGHKEAMEDTVIVRDMETRYQETVHADNLAAYLKKLKFRK